MINFLLFYNQKLQANLNYKAINEIEKIIKNKGIKEPEWAELTEDIARLMIASIDKYSVFMNKEEYENLQKLMLKSFTGIGVVIQKRENKIKIVEVLENSPAEKAQLKIGDSILSINQNRNLKEMNLQEVSKLIKGEIDLVVNLEIERNKKIYKYRIKREDVKIKSVKSKIIRKTLILQIVTFNNKTAEEIKDILFNQNINYKNIIIDLRNNHGGLLYSAIDVADIFLKENQLITKITDKKEEIIKEYFSTKKDKDFIVGKDIYLLINEESASAAEILTAALKDNNIANVYGNRSFGKATVQELIELDYMPNCYIKITTAKYKTPKGKDINTKGIEPDLEMRNIKYEDFIRGIIENK